MAIINLRLKAINIKLVPLGSESLIPKITLPAIKPKSTEIKAIFLCL